MSALTESLQRILKWLKLNYPKVSSFHYAGLTNEQIEELTKDLPFRLTKEVYELYQWSNGTLHGDGFFPFLVFYSLQESLDFYYCTVKYETDDNLLMSPRNSLIIFSWYKSFFYIVCDNQEKESSPIWLVHMGAEPVICYTSLTNLMLMIAECYETGAYYINQEGFLEEDRAKSASIFCKYNPGIKNGMMEKSYYDNKHK
ncbi:SMI1/KNR4 family protein [Calothrix sp. NIES-2098]|uniref:SMI1/KNR4 family protein n=1 Tax=Calothrix sp. NIES-2098 TaxID=1954171 RepID=UPI000B61561C|nr:PBS lyase HEAT-like repeat protein [Calothrix sp. NIES-2098]